MFTVVCSAAKMASASSETVMDINAERRKRVLLGSLPGDFLQVGGPPESSQEAADRQAALALQHQLAPQLAAPSVGRLSITLGQAKLVKNYGMTRMDPYVRLRVGHCVYESHTDPNGGKNPRWNKIINSLLPAGVTNIYLEIFDECSFTPDELIAWAHIPIPPNVVQGETHEDWYPLNGKQGDGMEGMINLVFSYSLAPAPMPYLASAYPQPLMMMPSPMMGYAPVAMYHQPMGAVHSPTHPQQPPHPQLERTPALTEDELEQIHEMFPSVEKEVIKSVSEANRGNKDATVTSLLQMSE